MGYVNLNLNPANKMEDDCVCRAIAFVMDKTWNEVYMDLSMQGFLMKSKMDKNYVWGAYLKKNGFKRYIIPNTCPDCYTISNFVEDNPNGVFLLATDGHVVGVKDGNYYDTTDTGYLVPLYYWKKEDNE